jgi:hypothetical protein
MRGEPRFMGLADGRETSFKDHVEELKKDMIRKRIEDARIVKEKFVELMDESELNSESRYDDFKRKYGGQVRFLGLKEVDRNEVFNDYVIDLGQTERKIHDMQRMEASLREREREVESQRRGAEGRIQGVKRESDRDAALGLFNALMIDWYTGFDIAGLDAFIIRCKADKRWERCEGMPKHVQQAAFSAFGKGLWDKLTKVLGSFLADKIGRCACLSVSW